MSAGKVAGFENLLPKPDADQGYAWTKGVPSWATATYSLYAVCGSPTVEKLVALPIEAGKVFGLEYLLPNPDPDQG